MSRMQDLQEHLRATAVDRGGVAKLFDEASPPERVQLLESIDGRGQARLWEATAGRKISIQQLVPRERGPLVPVIFHGKNSLPAFTRFQKRFCRPSGEPPSDELWGYNYQPARWLGTLTGPGYFVAYDSDNPWGSVAVDYRRIPSERPASWPETDWLK